MKKCLKCGFELNDGIEYCPECGTKVEENKDDKVSGVQNEKKFCLYCGEQIDSSAVICPKCGANFATGDSGKSSSDNINRNVNNSQYNNIGSYNDSSEVTTAFIFSLIGLLCCAIFAIPGLLKANNCLIDIDSGRIPQDKRGMAMAAKIISIISLALWIINFVLAFTGRGFMNINR